MVGAVTEERRPDEVNSVTVTTLEMPKERDIPGPGRTGPAGTKSKPFEDSAARVSIEEELVPAERAVLGPEDIVPAGVETTTLKPFGLLTTILNTDKRSGRDIPGPGITWSPEDGWTRTAETVRQRSDMETVASGELETGPAQDEALTPGPGSSLEQDPDRRSTLPVERRNARTSSSTTEDPSWHHGFSPNEGL